MIRPIDASGWAARRSAVRDWWLDHLRPLAVQRPPPQVEVLGEDRDAGVIRQRIRYRNDPERSLEAYLLTPLTSAAGARPGVVALHSTNDDTIRQCAGLGRESSPGHAFGLDLAQRGCVVLCPINMLWTGSCDRDFDPAQALAEAMAPHPGSTGMAKMLFDAQRAVDVLLTLPMVDPTRIGCAGHSLGGKEALYLAAFDERIAAAVSSEGGLGLAQSNWDAAWYLGASCRAPDFAHDHHELLALIAPRPFLLIGGDSADGEVSRPCIDAVRPLYQDAPGCLELFNHRQGHVIPPEAKARLVDWLVEHLAA